METSIMMTPRKKIRKKMNPALRNLYITENNFGRAQMKKEQETNEFPVPSEDKSTFVK
ncbi:MAG: hypothetical protein WBL27_02995 [Salinimicrobium sp.]